MVLVGDAARVPLVAFGPLHPPEATHDNALVADQVTVEILPGVMLVGLAEIVTVGLPKPIWETAGEASSNGDSAIIATSALARCALATSSEVINAERTCVAPNPIKSCCNPRSKARCNPKPEYGEVMVRHALPSDDSEAINRKGSHGRLAAASLLMSAAVPVPPSWPSDPNDTIS